MKKNNNVETAPETGAKKAMRPRTKVLLIAAGAVLAVAAVAAVVFAGNLNAIWANDVPIVDQPTAVVTDAPEPSLEIIDTLPPEELEGDDDGDIITPAPVLAAPAASATATAAPTATPAPTKEMPIYRQVPIDASRVNVLLIGLDARSGEKSGRSDTMLLVSYNRKKQSVALVSFLRDTWVPIEGHGWNRLNACYAFGGIGLTVNTINKQFGLDVQNYIVIRFEAMESVIDELGGVTITLTKEEANYYNKQTPGWTPVRAGTQVLNGAHTLQHMRNRYVGHADFDRTRRQRDVLLAVFKKLKQKNDPVLLSKLLEFSIKNVKTNMKPETLFSLALESLEAKGLKINEGQVPADGTWQYARVGGRSVLKVNIKKNAEYLKGILK